MVNEPIASVRFVTLAIRRTYERRTRNGASAVVIAALTMATLVAIVSAAITIALAPFLVLLSYVLRIASVTKRTLAIGPFTIRDTTD